MISKYGLINSLNSVVESVFKSGTKRDNEEDDRSVRNEHRLLLCCVLILIHCCSSRSLISTQVQIMLPSHNLKKKFSIMLDDALISGGQNRKR